MDISVQFSGTRSAKMNKIIDIIRAHDSKPGKVVIFSTYKSFLTLLSTVLKEEFGNTNIAQIDGSVSGKERSRIIDSFQNDEASTKVLLCSTKAAGVGVTLTAGSLVIISDPWWNPGMHF